MNFPVIFFLLTVFVLNILLYLSLNFNHSISYLILTLVISLNFYLYKRQEKKNYKQPQKESSAEDHPIIKAARERLKK